MQCAMRSKSWKRRRHRVISAQTFLTTTAVPALDSMEKRNLVRRTRDPKDRRKYYVSLQDEGRRLVDEMLPELTEMISASLEGISAKDLRVFWKVMHQIEDNLTQMSQGDSVI